MPTSEDDARDSVAEEATSASPTAMTRYETARVIELETTTATVAVAGDNFEEGRAKVATVNLVDTEVNPAASQEVCSAVEANAASAKGLESEIVDSKENESNQAKPEPMETLV